MTLDQIASILAERAGKKSDNTFIREMKDLVIIKRARIIANSLSKNPSLDKNYMQGFKVAVKLIDITDECSIEDPECIDKAWITTVEIPQPIRYGVNPFAYVGSIGGSKGFGWTTFGNESFLKRKILTGKNPRYTWRNNRIVIFNKDLTEAGLGVEGVFGDPREVSKFKACDGKKSCYSDEQEFPIDEQNVELIIRDLMTNELRLNVVNEKNVIREDHND